MLQALFHKKLKDSFENPHFKKSEDSLTSSVLGLIQYLPDDMVWELLRISCGKSSRLPESIGAILSFHFWDKWDAAETGRKFVEPDVWIDTENYAIIIEAKKYDACNMQYSDQWEREIKALLNENNGESRKEIIFIALGGNDSLVDDTCEVDRMVYTIHTASWFNLLHAVVGFHETIQEGREHRLLTDIIRAFSIHEFYDITWLDTLVPRRLSGRTSSVIKDTLAFDNHKMFRGLYRPHNKFNSIRRQIWKK